MPTTYHHHGAKPSERLLIAAEVLNDSPVICFRWLPRDWQVHFVSSNISRWGYSPEALINGRIAFRDMVYYEDLERVQAEVEGYTTNRLGTFLQEYRILTARGEVIWVEDRTIVRRNEQGDVLFYDGLLTDINQRKQQQEAVQKALVAQRELNRKLEEAHNQLLQSEKMASIGQLAAGVAHELNNPIGFVHSNMGTLEGYIRDLMAIIDSYDDIFAQLPSEVSAERRIQQIKEERDFSYLHDDIFPLLSESRDGLSRVKKIVQDLRSFSRVGEQNWQAADLHEGLDSTLNIVWHELKYKCTVRKDYGLLPAVDCLISQLNQVFMNLLVNAGQAIEDKGEIQIITRQTARNEISIKIIDNGSGIEPEHLNRIFEPFFTTKPVGKGTGLGLSLSYSIIERHHGHIVVTSTPGQGTCFEILLPIHQPQTEADVND